MAKSRTWSLTFVTTSIIFKQSFSNRRKMSVLIEKNSKNNQIIENQDSDEENQSDDFEGDSQSEPDQNGSGSDGDDDADSEGDEGANGNVGWADSIAKILKTNKPKGKKTLILSKAKKHKITDTEIEPKVGFEVIDENGEEKPVVVKKEEKDVEEEPVVKKKRELHPDLRVKPNILEKEKEKLLSKIATRGVVQLFNAVRNQQKDIQKKMEDAGPLERKKEKVIKSLDKNQFLDKLMGQSKSENVNKLLEIKKETKKEEKPTWNVFREDFMMGAKMKDWDKKEAAESESDENESEDSD